MNKIRRLLTAGTSAALVASLAVFAVPAIANAAVSGSSVSLGRGGSSTPSASWLFVEESVGGFPATGFTMTIAIATPGVTFLTGAPPIISGPGSLGGLTAAYIGPTSLLVTALNSNPYQVEQFSLSGLGFSASQTAPVGPVTFTYTTTGLSPSYWGGNTTTASGAIAPGYYPAGATSVLVSTFSTPFVTPLFGGAGPITLNPSSPTAQSFGVGSVTVSANGCGGACLPSQQMLTLAAPGLLVPHVTGESVIQNTLSPGLPTLPSIATIGNTAFVIPGLSSVILPGQNNQPFGGFAVCEGSAGYIPAGATVTFTITTPGVQFATATGVDMLSASGMPQWGFMGSDQASGMLLSNKTSGVKTLELRNTLSSAPFFGAPGLLPNTQIGGPATETITAASVTGSSIAAPVINLPSSGSGTVSAHPAGTMVMQSRAATVLDLSADRTVASLTFNRYSSMADCLGVYGTLDVSLMAQSGASISINVGGITVSGNPIGGGSTTNNRVTATATAPSISIGGNDQAGGPIVLRESFTGAITVGQIIFTITSGETFTRAPIATVDATSGLRLSGPGSVPTLSTTGTLGMGGTTASFTVYSPSSSALSTITLSDPTNPALGPRYNVPGTLTPGPTTIRFAGYLPASAVDPNAQTLVTDATRVFGVPLPTGTFILTAATNPAVYPGFAGQYVGDVTLTESATNTFSVGQKYLFRIRHDAVTGLPVASFASMPTLGGSSGITATIAKTSSLDALCATITGRTSGIASLRLSNMTETVVGGVARGAALPIDTYGTCAELWIPETPPVMIGSATNAHIATTGSGAFAAVAVKKTINPALFVTRTISVPRGTVISVRAYVVGTSYGTRVKFYAKTGTSAWKYLATKTVGLDGYAYYTPRAALGTTTYRAITTANVSVPTAITNLVKVIGR